MKIRALSSFFHPQEGARAEGRDTQRCCIPMHPHRRVTQTRLLRLAHAVKYPRQMSPCRRQQLRREAQPPCALLHRVQALGSENLNRLKLVLVSAGCSPQGLCAKTIVPSIAADGSPPRRQVPEQRLVQGAVCVCGVRSCEHNVLAETAGPTATWEPVRLETRTRSLT